MSVAELGGIPVVVARNFKFRTEQLNVQTLGYISLKAELGSHNLEKQQLLRYSLTDVDPNTGEDAGGDDAGADDPVGDDDNLPLSAKPNETNTGNITPESQLIKNSGMTISTDGAVIEKRFFSGTVTVNANNVTIRDCVIRTSSSYGIKINSGKTGILIENCKISGMTSAAVYGSNFTARRLNVYNSGNDGFKPTDNFVIENCYVHKLGYISTAHADGVQMVKGSNGVIRNNNFDMPHNLGGYKNSQVMIIQTNVGTINNIRIIDNWINGGGISVQIRDKKTGYGAPKNVQLLNNRFGRDFQFAPWKIDGDAVKRGNVWDDTGALMPNQ
jgi:hypothetical protein